MGTGQSLFSREDRPGVIVQQHASLMERYYSVSVLAGKLHVVGHYDHELSLLHQLAYQLAQQFDPLRILSPCRFVQDHDRSVHGDHGRCRYPFTLGHPKVVRLLLSYSFQVHEIYCSSDQTLRFFGTRAHVVRSKANLFLYRAPEELIVRVLEGQSHLSGELGDPVFPRVHAPDQHAAPRRSQQAVEMLGKSRLAGAVLSDDTDASLVQTQRDTAYGGYPGRIIVVYVLEEEHFTTLHLRMARSPARSDGPCGGTWGVYRGQLFGGLLDCEGHRRSRRDSFSCP